MLPSTSIGTSSLTPKLPLRPQRRTKNEEWDSYSPSTFGEDFEGAIALWKATAKADQKIVVH